MGLPKNGIKVEDLICKQCGKKLSEVRPQAPQTGVDCNQNDCPQKPKTE